MTQRKDNTNVVTKKRQMSLKKKTKQTQKALMTYFLLSTLG